MAWQRLKQLADAAGRLADNHAARLGAARWRPLALPPLLGRPWQVRPRRLAAGPSCVPRAPDSTSST
eukprot:8739099-Pyramimonas_sp.AAC.1